MECGDIMEDKFVYLTISQGFALASQIEELKKNPYFRDSLSESFTQEVYAQAADITVKSMGGVSNVIQKIQKHGDKIAIPKSKFEYITRLTGTNFFDEETMSQYMDEVNQVSSENQNNLPKSR